MRKITFDVLIPLMGIGNVTCLSLAITVVNATAIIWATMTVLRQYLYYTRQIMTCEPIDII